MLSFLVPVAFGFLMVVFRVGAMFTMAPVFGARSIPARVRMAASMSVAMAIFLGAGAPPFERWESISALLGAAVVESLIGLSMGLGARLVLDAAYAAGQVASQAMGLGFGAILDPVQGASSTSIAEICGLLATATLLATGGHREIVAALARSVAHAPAGSTTLLITLLGQVATSALGGIALAVRLAYPVLAAVLVGQVALGVLSRTAPQLNMGSLGFSVTILAGGGVLYVTVPTIAHIVARATIERLAGH